MNYSKIFWILFFLYIVLRIYFICTFPPFTDESLYVRWGQLMVQMPEYRWISISQLSRQPLAFWIFGYGSLLTMSPVIGARLLMLLFNIPVFFFIFSITKRIKNEAAALLAVYILSITPIFILLQSLALMDGILFSVASFIAWMLQKTWNSRSHWLHICSIAIGLSIAIWTKTTGLYILGLTVLSLLFVFKRSGILYGASVSFITLILSLPLILRPDIQKLFDEPSSFLLTTAELSVFPWHIWASNMWQTIIGLSLYLSPVLILISILYWKKIKRHAKLYEYIWILIPILISIFFAKNFRFRYFAFSFPILVPFFGILLQNFFLGSKKYTMYSIFALLSLYSIFFIWQTPLFFRLFPQNSGERDYALGWPSGYGIAGVEHWIDSQPTSNAPLVVAVIDSPGNPSDYILSRYFFSTSVKVLFVTVTSQEEFNKILPITQKVPVYLVTRSTLLPPWIDRFIVPITLQSKPFTTEKIGIYRIRIHK